MSGGGVGNPLPAPPAPRAPPGPPAPRASARAARVPDLGAISDRVRTCTWCDLAATRIHAVPGEGSPQSGILLVGEAPGRNEDETGRPFCGAAGKNLDLGLASAGIARSDVFVTSIVKCRPPKNRDPTPHEKESCRPHLVAQLEALQPRVVVALGRHGLSGLTGAVPGDFSELAGSFVAGPDGLPIFVSMHPAAVLYRQAWKQAYLAHWAAFGAWYRSGLPASAYVRPSTPLPARAGAPTADGKAALRPRQPGGSGP